MQENHPAEERFAKTQFAAWIGIVGNAILAVMKGIVGYMVQSKALVADAAHSASDVAGSVAVLIGLRAAQIPPDQDHPYGHGKAESVAAIVVSILLFVVGIEIVLSSTRSLFEPMHAPGILAAVAAFVSILAKEAMFRYKYRLGKKYRSDAVIANAYEHRSDVFSSAAALVGIAGAVIGGRWDIGFLLYFDPLAGIVVSLLVLRMAYLIARKSIHNTLDHVLHDEDSQGLVNAVKQVNGVLRVDEFLAREHGHYVIVDTKIGVDPEMTVEEGHAIAKEVKRTLTGRFSYVHDAFVHVNPYEATYPYNVPDQDRKDQRPWLH